MKTKCNLPIKDRLMLHVQLPENLDDCWIWIGGKNNIGYGNLKINHKMFYAHRVSFELFVGPIPKGLFVCHSCDNKICVNPKHLFLGTQQDNMNDKMNKNRQSHSTKMRGENHGSHKLTEQNIYQIREMIEQGYTIQKIADVFEISPTNISNIKAGRKWGWLK